MKSLKFLLYTLLIFGIAASDGVWGRSGSGHSGGHSGGHSSGGHSGGHSHGHARFGGGFFVAPFVYPWYYNPYPTNSYYALQPPVVYIEQGDPSTGQGSGGYWYRCDNPAGFFPYVKECPLGWRQVVPTPSPY